MSVDEVFSDVRPPVPRGVDPAKALPGMSISFAEYREKVQAFYEAVERFNRRVTAVTEEDGIELERMARELDPHTEAYGTWRGAYWRASRRRLGLLVLFAVTIGVLAIAWQVYRIAQVW